MAIKEIEAWMTWLEEQKAEEVQMIDVTGVFTYVLLNSDGLPYRGTKSRGSQRCAAPQSTYSPSSCTNEKQLCSLRLTAPLEICIEMQL